MKTINYQPPAEGITLLINRPDYKVYKIACECMTDQHTITMQVTADGAGVCVEHSFLAYTSSFREYIKHRYDIKNDFFSDLHYWCASMVNTLMNRLRLTWDIWTKYHIEMEAGTVMTAQQALNYAETLRRCVNHVKECQQANE